MNDYLILQAITGAYVQPLTYIGRSYVGNKSFLTLCTPIVPANFYYLGQVPVGTSNQTPYAMAGTCFAVQGSDGQNVANPCLQAPTGFLQTFWNNPYPTIGLYMPIAPPGYVPVGMIWWDNTNVAPQPSDFPGLMCVRQDLVTPVSLGPQNLMLSSKPTSTQAGYSIFQQPNSLAAWANTTATEYGMSFDIIPPSSGAGTQFATPHLK